MVEIYHGNDFWLSTSNPKTLLSVSRVIAEFATALNDEGIKNAVKHNQKISEDKGKTTIEEL